MMTLSAVSVLCGLIIGLRFRIMALLPCNLLVAAVGVASIAVGNTSLVDAGLGIMAWCLGSQGGYLLTACCRAAMPSVPQRSVVHN